MSKKVDNKEDFGQEKEVVSRTRGIIIFSIIATILFGLFLYFNLTENKNSVIPNPSISPTSSSSPIVTPTPLITRAPEGETSIPVQIAANIGEELSARNWAGSATDSITIISNNIDPTYLPTISAKIKALDWAGCVKTHCLIGPELGKSTVTVIDSNNIDVTQVIVRYQNYKTPLPSDTWHIHMNLQTDGEWRVTAISGPGF